MSRIARLRQDLGSPIMSSNRKKAESIASSMMILVDFDGAMVTDAVCLFAAEVRGGREKLSLLSVRSQRAGDLLFCT